jgi:hypothetical protein
MLPEHRKRFNSSFSDIKYKHFLDDLNNYAGEKIPFRIAETPLFIGNEFYLKVTTACDQIIDFISKKSFKKVTASAIPDKFNVPGDEGQPMFLAFDFAVCRNKENQLSPMLIEMQGFPSLFFYQNLLAKKYREHFDVDKKLTHLFNRSEDAYLQHLKKLLLNGHNPENVILLEVEPETQTTRIDFLATEHATGIHSVCISKVIFKGKKLYYENSGRTIPIHRIYNRVIFDELIAREDLIRTFNLTEDVEVEWAGHPNWFFRISKFVLPFIHSEFVPQSTFVHELKSIPDDLEHYVLKPLYSFSGSGVKFHVEREDIESLSDPQNWILQRKVDYMPVVEAPDGKVKAELRMMYSWDASDTRPKQLISMARLSRGEMIGVKYNKDKTWVGGSVGFFEI